MRFRFVFLVLGSLLAGLAVFLTDPDVKFIQNLPVGASTIAMFVTLTFAVFYVGFLHISRKGLADYLDLQIWFNKAFETPHSAGLGLIAVGLMMIAISIVILASAIAMKASGG